VRRFKAPQCSSDRQLSGKHDQSGTDQDWWAIIQGHLLQFRALCLGLSTDTHVEVRVFPGARTALLNKIHASEQVGIPSGRREGSLVSPPGTNNPFSLNGLSCDVYVTLLCARKH
jgi:hypothetical protein